MPAARTVFTAMILAVVAPMASAAERDQMSAAAQCVSIEDEAARLACYDQAFGRSPASGGTSSTISGAAAPEASAAASASGSPDAVRAVDEFGLSESARRKRDPERAKETMPESISSTVERVSFRPTGEVVVALENGQVWEQAEAVTMAARVAAGDVVTIRKAALGSFAMVTPNRTAIRVRRVR